MIHQKLMCSIIFWIDALTYGIEVGLYFVALFHLEFWILTKLAIIVTQFQNLAIINLLYQNSCRKSWLVINEKKLLVKFSVCFSSLFPPVAVWFLSLFIYLFIHNFHSYHYHLFLIIIPSRCSFLPLLTVFRAWRCLRKCLPLPSPSTSTPSRPPPSWRGELGSPLGWVPYWNKQCFPFPNNHKRANICFSWK